MAIIKMIHNNNENDSNNFKKVFKTNKMVILFIHFAVGGGQRGKAGLTRR